MRTQSFLLAFLLIVMSLLPLTFASPLPPAGDLNKRQHCFFVGCRLQEGVGEVTFTPTPTRSLASPTSTSSSSSTVETPQGAPEAWGPDSVLQPSTTSATATASPSGSANAGVALASHGTLFCTLLAGSLWMVLAL